MLSEFVVIALLPPLFCGENECACIDMGKNYDSRKRIHLKVCYKRGLINY